MGKKRRAKKLQRKLAAEARKLTLPKVLKLMAKTFVLVFGISVLLAFGIAAGLEWLKSLWAQLLVYGAGYFLAYRWLMADFLPPPVEALEKRKK